MEKQSHYSLTVSSDFSVPAVCTPQPVWSVHQLGAAHPVGGPSQETWGELEPATWYSREEYRTKVPNRSASAHGRFPWSRRTVWHTYKINTELHPHSHQQNHKQASKQASKQAPQHKKHKAQRSISISSTRGFIDRFLFFFFFPFSISNLGIVGAACLLFFHHLAGFSFGGAWAGFWIFFVVPLLRRLSLRSPPTPSASPRPPCWGSGLVPSSLLKGFGSVRFGFGNGWHGRDWG
ncbi:hypothetical protein IWX90DRAFT_299452 [Phyllosticta citrichinensis]|uniref:Uncharacterized protein n=1 Tax=Phyllosticta citrichinensis TaxID=1130410 RepID=A0ABR1XKN2_9PEZI